jgi:hypothetical protein
MPSPPVLKRPSVLSFHATSRLKKRLGFRMARVFSLYVVTFSVWQGMVPPKATIVASLEESGITVGTPSDSARASTHRLGPIFSVELGMKEVWYGWV